MAKNYDLSHVIKVNPPAKKEIRIIRLLICCGLACMLLFSVWFLNPEHVGYAPIYWPLTFVLAFKFLKMLQEWYHYWSPSVPAVPEWKTRWTVDVLTTSCPGEPREMIIRTLRAMQAITYPHTSYLCDEGNDPVLKKTCQELGVVHVTRVEKKDAKAGNINNALKQATGEMCVILDPDHVPIPEFLDRVLPYFEDPAVGYVQCVQGYGNQSESFIARGAAEQSYHFYGPMMMSMNSYGTVQAIGANCTFRRKALDSIGGHAPGLAEDMHTAMQLQAKGWKPVYVPEILSRGLVPATLSSYYKQQLKWSRGCFELLFRVYPSLFRKFTWRQKIHHFTMPLYFLFGLVNLIDIAIPLVALGFAQVPWEVQLDDFAAYFLLLFGFSMAIRLYAQRWLLEKHESGFHFTGGVLRTATWWILLIGFVYAIFNIRVPYIPTPKEDEHQNYWVLCMPNLILVILCAILIYYGLSIDWTPYSLAMALFACMNACMLAFVSVISQQRLLNAIWERMKSISLVSPVHAAYEWIMLKVQRVFRETVRLVPVVLLASVSLALFGYNKMITHEDRASAMFPEKDYGGFYLGVFLDGADGSKQLLAASPDIAAFDCEWKEKLPVDLMEDIRKGNSMPMINWRFSREVLSEIKADSSENYLLECSNSFRRYPGPVMINFFPGFDEKKISPVDFVSLWQKVHSFFSNQGVSNLTWTWNPASFLQSSEYYPGDHFVDWIGIRYTGSHSLTQCEGYSMETGMPVKVLRDKPIVLMASGLAAYSRKDREIIRNNARIKGVVLHDERDFQLLANAMDDERSLRRKIDEEKIPSYHSPFVMGEPGNFRLMVNNEPFYVRGIAYNTGHDWRDGNVSLTRRQLEKDFSRIKQMGANTIRRYGFSFYDMNTLNLAEEHGLKCLYGFYFDPEVDYYRDTVKVAEYIEEVEAHVLKFRNHPAILGWALGNETWGLLKKKFGNPYLIKIRRQYVRMVELLAERIHELDPSHPVFTCVETVSHQLPGELTALHDGAPSVDVVGINCYYRQNISRLDEMAFRFDPERPYLVSEFGPMGYWDSCFNRTRDGMLIEQSEIEKSEWYKDQWEKYIIPNRGKNIGGIAYCWKDRMEGSNTWFGLTDCKGRKKPGYYALREIWQDQKPELIPWFSIVPQAMKAGLFSAVSSTGKTEGLRYEWSLSREDSFEEVGSTEISSDGRSVLIRVPDDHTACRLCLYVSDGLGNVTTASVPIRAN